MLNQQPFIQEVLMKEHLQNHEESIIHTLVVNLPMNKSTTCQKIVLQEVAPHSKREEKPRQELRNDISPREQVVLC
jgi:hypothetical protein